MYDGLLIPPHHLMKEEQKILCKWLSTGGEPVRRLADNPPSPNERVEDTVYMVKYWLFGEEMPMCGHLE